MFIFILTITEPGMVRHVVSTLSFCLTFFSMSGQTVRTDTVTVATFGKVFVYSSGAETPQNLIIMISGNGGWYGFEQSISNRLADKGISVTGIDIKKCILVFPAIE